MYLPQHLKLSDYDIEIAEASGFGSMQGFGKNPALLVIDVNHRFVGVKNKSVLESIEQWPTACGDRAWDTIPAIRKCLDVFRDSNFPVFYTTGDNRKNSIEHGRWAGKNSRVANQDNVVLDGNAIVEEVAPFQSEHILVKTKPSAFFGTSLMSYLNELRVDSLIITGGTTSGCIRATVVDAFSLNFRVGVVKDGVFDRFESSHEISLFDMSLKYADVLSSKCVVDYVGGLDKK